MPPKIVARDHAAESTREAVTVGLIQDGADAAADRRPVADIHGRACGEDRGARRLPAGCLIDLVTGGRGCGAARIGSTP